MDGPDGPTTCAMAKTLIGRAARQVAEETVQMQGGIAMTWDYAASHYAKRLTMLDHQLGDTDHCLAEVMRSL
ncbi:acyl-CoA dehydrogenase family protein [Paracoccus aestuarii]|uniref:acyl-CoA dehydrogenase family protein n=1 Tax=Paracoccus aestuarii TaxID=453842 RepID=UPI00234FE380|nr:acyl-CoA dehydrogenase family protein [Paracoccus aestuarii]